MAGNLRNPKEEFSDILFATFGSVIKYPQLKYMWNHGTDFAPSLRDTRRKLKLARGKYLAHAKNLPASWQFLDFFMRIFSKNKVKTCNLETFRVKQGVIS